MDQYGEIYFTVMNKIVCREIILFYPNFRKDFIIHMDDSITKVGGS